MISPATTSHSSSNPNHRLTVGKWSLLILIFGVVSTTTYLTIFLTRDPAGTSGGNSVFSQTLAQQGQASVLEETFKMPVLGGWKDDDPSGDEIRNVANRSLSLLKQSSSNGAQCVPNGCDIEIEKITAAAHQVVAGTNYKLDLDVKHVGSGCSGSKKHLQVVIYQDLKDNITITSCEQA